NPQNYIVEFMADGNVAVKADCNNALGSYTIAAQNIVIQMGPMTMAACPAESLSDQFVANLGMVNAWQVAEGQLRLEMMDGAGTMLFTAVVLP
ncbi:MAG: META domain-containing protein, partial [Anaerolineales bacterium]|nr:META domain-containing protein [Anaerolineales bacterium]